jgi:lipopolysaccharide transport system ATP-binding protein
MSNIVISVENLSKTYHLGQIGTGTFANDLNLWWAKMRGKPNPLLRIGEKDHGNRDGLDGEELWALRDVSFTVRQGEVLGIIGRNGAGKSTLLKILSRVTAPTSGKIKVKGRIASLLEVGTGFHPELTGRENIYLNGAILGMTKQEVTSKFDEIVNFSEVEKFIDTPVKRYSSGMYVRLAFAVAAHLEPEILVVDEVLAVGDVEFQKKCLGKMGDVAKEGKTVLLVSHNMISIKSLCQRSALLEKGKITCIGDASEVIDIYIKPQLEVRNASNFGNVAQGDGTIKLLSYEVKNRGDDNQQILTNSSVEICILVEAKRSIQYPACGIGFYSEKGALLTSINTVELGKNLPVLPAGKSKISVAISKMPYLPGNYFASFWIMSPQGHIYINAEKSISFNIVQTAVYGTCEIDDRWGSVYLPIDFIIAA